MILSTDGFSVIQLTNLWRNCIVKKGVDTLINGDSVAAIQKCK